ncbi:hypothetical protein K439DRAFT_1628492 [Ramaria rubella]|nr:hypothetical protein K439DRAFT_1628492 [Ramaria rubella]
MSGLLVDIEEELNMPGGVGFIDATDVLVEATKEMEFGTILNMDGYDLSDAMSALEIMDPRMDTGMTVPPPPFSPNMPLLPSEVCWILDRTFACEMSWHTGLALSQTVYTLRYVHYLRDITYPRFKADNTASSTEPFYDPDPERPLELVTLVLRAGVFGMLKCCDLVWREVARDHLVDGEDWNSDKYGVSLCEHIQPEAMLSLLNDAVTWLRESPSLSSSTWRDPLIQRLLMRKNIFQTLSYPSFPALYEANECLANILAGPPLPEPSELALNVFDPAIARRLVSFVPTRSVDLPPQSEVWEAFTMWLDRWQEVRRLIGAKSLWSVKTLASLRAYEVQSPGRSAFLRSLSISTFFDGSKILLTHDPPWLIDRFFSETIALPPGMLCRLTEPASRFDKDSSSASSDKDFRERDSHKEEVELFEKGVAKLLVDYFTSFYHNRPRQRRRLASSLLNWHLALEHASDIVTKLSSITSSESTLSRVPLIIRHTRLSIITEVIFSGFELELYARHEWVMVYWYLGRILSTQIAVLDDLYVSLLREDEADRVRQALGYISVQRDYAEALRYVVVALRDMMYHYPPSKVQIDPEREQANFEKRFKWAFISGYSEATTLDEDRPILGMWRRWRNEHGVLEMSLVLENFTRAQASFLHLSERNLADTAAGFCEAEYKEFMRSLAQTCATNLALLQKSSVLQDVPEWVWDETSRWFPQIKLS